MLTVKVVLDATINKRLLAKIIAWKKI
uniref:Uncharacterized protein n=1 Tax=Rhizophora mucronata TaxID=61149 RepID=A0A2P2Q0K0_RHIMU